MIDILVSRFLYVLCWRNKVVIILIILSASMGMLITLSYHGNKHPSTVDEVLHSGKGHLPLENHFINLNVKSHSTIDTVKGYRERKLGFLGHQGQIRFLEKDRARLKQAKEEKATLKPNLVEFKKVSAPPRKEQIFERLKYPKQLEQIKDNSPSTTSLTVKRGHQQLESKPVVENRRVMGGEAHGPRPTPRSNKLYPAKGDISYVKYLGGQLNTNERDDKSKFRDSSLQVKNYAKIKASHVVDYVVTKGRLNKEPDLRLPPMKPNKSYTIRETRSNTEGITIRLKPRNENIQYPSNKYKIKQNLESSIRSESKPIYYQGGSKTQKETKALKIYQVVQNRFKNPILNIEQETDSSIHLRQKMSEQSHLVQNKQPSENKFQSSLLADVDSKKKMTDSIQLLKLRNYRRLNSSLSAQRLPIIVNKMQNLPKTYTQPPTRRYQNIHNESRRHLYFPKNQGLKLNTSERKSDLQQFAKLEVVKTRVTSIPQTHFVKGSHSATATRVSVRSVTRQVNMTSMIFALTRQRKPAEDFIPYHASRLYRPKNSWPEILAQWVETEEIYCDGHFVVVNSEFAMLKEVIIDRNFCHGRNGGEEIHEVINQPEDEEYYTYFPGFFQLKCHIKPQYFFNNKNHLNQWLYSMNSGHDETLYSEVREQFTIAIVRYEYANLYHTTTDFYNAFLLMEFYNKTQVETNILIVDGHPKGALDPAWDVLFNSSRRINKQSTRTKYSQLVWGILGYNSPIMDHYAPSIPLVEEFRTFFLSSYRIADTRKLDCDKINILFIWRRDYVAHPRNPSGSISRKIQNEQELVVTLRQDFPTFSVKGIQIDLFEMNQQLKFITETDILIGMHGAGLTHAMFLPKHAGMIELLPTYWSAANEHFHAIARWRHLHYRQWVNADPLNEAPNHFTKIPAEVLNELVTEMVKVVCGLTTDPPDVFMEKW